VPYQIVSGDNGDAWVESRARNSPPARSRLHPAEDEGNRREFPGREVSQAVITVPAIHDSQRQATKDAGKIAGWRCCASSTSRRRPPWPTPGQEAWHDRGLRLGGGTFDISVLEIGDGVFEVNRPMATPPRREDFDARSSTTWPTSSKGAGHRLRKESPCAAAPEGSGRKAKIELSSSVQTEVNLPSSPPTPPGRST